MAEQDLLQSWKEIAAYLGRSERTCRRWETEFELPVHRMDGSARGSVFAYKSELDRWMDEILHEREPREPVKARKGYGRWLIATLAFAVVLAIAIAVMVLRDGDSGQQRPPSSGIPSLAILPFVNNTGDEELDFWENAIADLLVSDLSQSRYLNVLSQDRVFLVLRDLGRLDAYNDHAIDLGEIAARAQVDNVVVGNFIRAGQRFRISATVRHIPSGESVVLPAVEARSEEEILLRIDELSTEIKNRVMSPGDRSRRDLDLDVGTITTSSLEAYRFYVEGRSSWNSGDAIGAMEAFERAVAIDPEFAMAYNWLAVCYSSLPGYEDEAEESHARAFELSHHASPRERLFVQGQYYMSPGESRYDRAIETFQEFVRAYPDDELVRLYLGSLYRRTEQWERCIETLEPLIGVQVFSSHIFHLRRAHCALGQYDAALEVARGTEPDHYPLQYRHQLALNLVYERSFEAALLEADRMLERAPGHASALLLKGDVHLFRAEWNRAEPFYRELLNPIDSEHRRLRLRLTALRRLTDLYRARGQLEQASVFVNQAVDEVKALGERPWLVVVHFDRAEHLHTQGEQSAADAEILITMAEAERRNLVSGTIGCLHLRGLILLELGDIRGAEEAADELKREIEGWINPRMMRRWHRLEGHIALARNDLAQAVEHFEAAVSLVGSQHNPDGDGLAAFYSSLAHAYYLSGDLAAAQEWYEKILALTYGRLNFGDFYAKSHFMLGKIYEQRGMKAEAIRSYRSFLDLWREADSPIPEIEEARRALSELVG
jgi:tetratricopeptide (TPR) repeat protein